MNVEKQIGIAMCIALIASLSIVVALAPHPLVSTVHVNSAYTLRWNGNNATLIVVYPSVNSTISVIHGENFVVNGSASVYDNNELVTTLP